MQESVTYAQKDTHLIGNGGSEREKLERDYKDIIKINPRLNRRLVSFQANKKVPFYSWFAYKEGFSSRMVKMFIKKYPKEGGKILDPFSGSGTTLFAANEMGFDALGIEILPIGEFILKSREAAEQADLEELKTVIKELKSIDFSKLSIDDETSYKHLRITENAFPQDTEHKLNAFLKYLNDDITDKNIKQVLKFSVFSILEQVSYTRKDGQYLRWDFRSGRTKTKFKKGKIFSFEEALFGQLHQILSDIKNIEIFSRENRFKSQNIELVTGSCLEKLPTLESESIDLIISSPPYCNRYDYTRTYALELAFLGVDGEELKRLRQSLLTCTVENREKTDYLRNAYQKNGLLDSFNKAEKSFNSNNALQEILSILRDYKEKKVLNNPGIYRMVKNYFYEHAFVVHEMARLLKEGGRVYYVNDNVRYAGETIPVDLILSEFARDAGLEVKNIFKLPNGKGNSSQQMGAYGREELRKCVYDWRKNGS